jgi:UDP-2,3-diacylglucosamine hydrolase
MDIQAPSHWRCIDFISDLHLQAADRLTFSTWSAYMQTTQADAVFILGDLFEVWFGDDAALVVGSFEAECVSVLRQTGSRLALHIMQGNRDFLMGSALMQACLSTPLPDPSVLSFADKRWLLSHGDALCVDDLEYQVFRKQVRSSAWQQDFLRRPLAERQEIARAIRHTSASRKRDGGAYADVNADAALAVLHRANSAHLLHGHTHLPGEHLLAPGTVRTVLSDWDANASPPRAEVLRITAEGYSGCKLVRLSLPL